MPENNNTTMNQMDKTRVPRFVIAGTNSGCGKTTITCAILQALVDRGMTAGAFKCGPDYIDPMFHSRIIGAESSNLDAFFFSENTLRFLLAENAAGCDISVIEGVMGFYDGMGLDSLRGSTCEIAQITDSPVVLALNARGASLSVLAVIEGFLRFAPDSHICGVILNQCTASTYQILAEKIRQYFDGRVLPLGYLPVMKECSLESRHLGLVTAGEIKDLKDKLQILARQAEKSLDLDGLIRLAGEASPVSCSPVSVKKFQEPVRIGVARDNAFCFYYEDSLSLLEKMGAELVPFSPLTDPDLPEGLNGLYFGGGYPELYAEQLSRNHTMLKDIRSALNNKIPCIAECGGFMYLGEKIVSGDARKAEAGGNTEGSVKSEDAPGCREKAYSMVGYLPGQSFDTGKLCRFGYVTLTAQKDTMLCKKGESIPAHEFHHWNSDDPGSDFLAEKVSGKSWDCVHADPALYAGYPHFHFYANPLFAENFYRACLSGFRKLSDR